MSAQRLLTQTCVALVFTRVWPTQLFVGSNKMQGASDGALSAAAAVATCSHCQLFFFLLFVFIYLSSSLFYLPWHGVGVASGCMLLLFSIFVFFCFLVAQWTQVRKLPALLVSTPTPTRHS